MGFKNCKWWQEAAWLCSYMKMGLGCTLPSHENFTFIPLEFCLSCHDLPSYNKGNNLLDSNGGESTCQLPFRRNISVIIHVNIWNAREDNKVSSVNSTLKLLNAYFLPVFYISAVFLLQVTGNFPPWMLSSSFWYVPNALWSLVLFLRVRSVTFVSFLFPLPSCFIV